MEKALLWGMTAKFSPVLSKIIPLPRGSYLLCGLACNTSIFSSWGVTWLFTQTMKYADLNLKNPQGIITHWLDDILEFKLKVVAITGKDNVVADALSQLTEHTINLVDVPSHLQQRCISDVHKGALGGHLKEDVIWAQSCLRLS